MIEELSDSTSFSRLSLSLSLSPSLLLTPVHDQFNPRRRDEDLLFPYTAHKEGGQNFDSNR